MDKNKFLNNVETFINQELKKVDGYNEGTLGDDFFDDLYFLMNNIQSDYEESLTPNQDD